MARTMTALVTLFVAAIASPRTAPGHDAPRSNAASFQQAAIAQAPAAPLPIGQRPDTTENSPRQTPEPCAPGTAPAGGIDHSTAVQLLDRVQAVLDEAVKGESPTSVTPVGTSGSKDAKAADGKVKLDRSLVDEMRAELSQVRTLLKK